MVVADTDIKPGKVCPTRLPVERGAGKRETGGNVIFVEGVPSPFSLMKASKGAYGESPGEWTAAEAQGFSRMLALPGIFYTRAGRP